MKLIDFVCDPAEKHVKNAASPADNGHFEFKNEDAIYFGGYYAVVLDGVTSKKNKLRIPGKTDAQWFVTEVIEQINRHITPTVPLKQLLVEIVRVVRLKYYSQIEAKYVPPAFQPSACISLIRENESSIEVFSLGDSPILIKERCWPVKEITDDTLCNYEKDFYDIAIELKNKNGLSIRESLPSLKSFAQEFHSKKNTEEGYWILGLNQHAIEHAAYFNFSKQEVEHICLLTDGLAQYYNLYSLCETPDEFIDLLKENKAQSLLSQIRSLEQNDPDFDQFPRSKQYDDASLLFIEI